MESGRRHIANYRKTNVRRIAASVDHLPSTVQKILRKFSASHITQVSSSSFHSRNPGIDWTKSVISSLRSSLKSCSPSKSGHSLFYLARQINSKADSDDVQELLESHN
ncbi:hypothetical protein TNCV_988281 [Trichonephila clavipes]|nr:hypothetical protein TNCV_988281 [Trichonephila clavipes]